MADDVVSTNSRLATTDGTIIAELPPYAGGRLGTVEGLHHQAAVARWRERLAFSRSGGSGALSAIVLIVGDSRVRNTVDLYRQAWPDRLRRRFLGVNPGSYGYLPPVEGALSQSGDGNWPGGDDPWTYTGATTGLVTHGFGWHAMQVPAAGTATITYFGDKITVFYAKTTGGPTAATVTIDGTSVGPLNARADPAVPGQQTQYDSGAYGFHTLVITPNDGPFVLEGVQWYDSDSPFFVVGSVQMYDASHAGFGAKDWASNSASDNWSAGLAGADGFFGMGITVLDVNDIGAGRTPAQFKDDLVTIVQRVDARLGTTTLGWLFVCLPTSVDTRAHRDAMYEAARTVGLGRAAVYDMAAHFSNRQWPANLSADGSHPSNAGHIWIAEKLGELLDPAPVTISPVTPLRQVIDATTPATSRSLWTAAVTPIAGTALAYDEATASALRERRHRVWLDAGTYQAVISAEHATGRGVLEVLIGRWADNTPTLTSCGTVDTSTPAGPAVTTTVLGTSVTTDVPGWVPVVIRKTNQANVGRFVQLVLNKTA